MAHIVIEVMDSARGLPAEGLGVILYSRNLDGWKQIDWGHTDQRGRLDYCPDTQEVGVFKLYFASEPYFRRYAVESCFRKVGLEFKVVNPAKSIYVRLQLGPFSYTAFLSR